MSMPDPRGWRERTLLVTLTWALLLGSVLVVTSLASALRHTSHLESPFFWLMLAAFAAMLPLRFLALDFRVRAWGMVSSFVIQGELALTQFGYVPGPVLVLCLTVILAGIMLGRSALIATLLGSACAMMGVGLAISTGYIPEPPGLLEGSDLASWAHGVMGYAVVTAVIAILIHYTLEKLVEAELALEESRRLESMGMLAGGVAHDFNNSLQVIRVWTQLLRARSHDPRILEGISAIDNAAESAGELTAQLLTVARRDAFAPSEISLTTLVSTWAESLRRLVPADIALELDIGDVGTIVADPSHLERILLNLVANASDAMGSRGRVEIIVDEVTADGVPEARDGVSSWVRMTVRDNGPGMSDDVRARIFEPFFTTKDEHGGTGLGLAIVASAVQRNSGVIHLETEPGRGSTFRLYFPRHRDRQAAKPVAPAQVQDPPAPKRAVVLFAEDERGVRESLRMLLSDAGFDVIPAEDGDAAMTILQRRARKIDVLCTDGVMPGCATNELIDHYLELNPAGRVLVCSGHVPEELMRRDIESSRYDFMSKPFPPDMLINRIRGMLDA